MIVNASSLLEMIYIDDPRKKDFEKTIIYNYMKFGKKKYIITSLSRNVPLVHAGPFLVLS